MEVIRDPQQMQKRAMGWRRQGVVVGLVPTMGFLHDGHLSLVRIAKAKSDVVVLSLFVNPTQFGPNEDLDRYPSNIQRDLELCEQEGVSVVFMPDADAVYAADASVFVQEEQLSQGLCGLSRPIHFRGVLTVVAKLFNLVLPDLSVFGEKDAQQIRLIRRMVRDLNFPIKIISGPIVREADGVAMSSRNSNLDAASREQAVVLRKSLLDIQQAVSSGECSVAALRKRADGHLADTPLGALDYLEFVDNETLESVAEIGERAVLLAMAVQFPGARLIDNIVLERGAQAALQAK
ncbi:pantoate--beta-alanine ligase [Kiritimatiellaeota bacterium B1221]|nr:pantoate--beta-alanine ligase [Kiritimatiellaeota bacterium B1221]